MQQLVAKKGVGVFLKMGVFSRDYGNHTDELHQSIGSSCK